MAASYDFVQLDVFTQTPLAGNPLAVFTDARGLTDKQMQALAREMNLSETTFILPREPELEATYGKRVRIFTTREELPFAGHPTLGTALYLYSTAETAPGEIILDLNVGKIPVRFTADSSRARNNRAAKSREVSHQSKFCVSRATTCAAASAQCEGNQLRRQALRLRDFRRALLLHGVVRVYSVVLAHGAHHCQSG
jgi:PhzF family phenazine biosynthesis protein